MATGVLAPRWPKRRLMVDGDRTHTDISLPLLPDTRSLSRGLGRGIQAVDFIMPCVVSWISG